MLRELTRADWLDILMLYVFDNPRRREHLLLSDAEKDVRRARGNEKMKEIAFELAIKLAAKSV